MPKVNDTDLHLHIQRHYEALESEFHRLHGEVFARCPTRLREDMLDDMVTIWRPPSCT